MSAAIVSLEAGVAQCGGELDRPAAGDERAAEALAAEASDHGGADPRAGADQQQVVGVNGLGHVHPPG
jgi:hypothetical protein